MRRGGLSPMRALVNQVAVVMRELGWFVLAMSAVMVFLIQQMAREPHAFDRPSSTFAAESLYSLIIFVAFMLPVPMWGRYPGRGRDYFWSLPVDQARHERARVLAGGFALLLCLLITVVASLIEQHVVNDVMQPWGLRSWLAYVLAPLVTYLLTSLFVLRAGRADVGWALAVIAALFVFGFGLSVDPAGSPGRALLSTLARATHIDVFFNGAFAPPEEVASWVRVAVAWTAVAVAGLYGVTSIRREGAGLIPRRRTGRPS